MTQTARWPIPKPQFEEVFPNREQDRSLFVHRPIDTNRYEPIPVCVCACLLRPFDGFHSFSPPPQHSFSDCSEWSANWSDVILRKLVVGMECRTSVTVSSDEYRGWYNLAGGVRRLLLGGKLGWMIFSFFFFYLREIIKTAWRFERILRW